LSVDEHVTVLVRQLAVLCGSEKRSRRPGAGVQDQHNGRLRLQLGRDVDEHLDAGRVGTKVLNLRQRGSFDELIGGSERGEAAEGN